MFCLATRTGGAKGCVYPIVQRKYAAPADTTTTVNIGTASEERIVVISGSQQSSDRNYALTLDGASPLTEYNGFSTPEGGNVYFGIWKVPTGTTATVITNGNKLQPMAVYSIYNWQDYKVLQFISSYGIDNWSFNANPLPPNSVIFGTWSSNEDNLSIDKYFNFGQNIRYYDDFGEHDDGAAFEVITSYNASKLITSTVSGKRRSQGFLALTCSNSII